MRKVPYMAVIGGREVEQGTAAVRVRGAGRKQEIVGRAELAERILEQTRTRTLRVGFDADEAPAAPAGAAAASEA
jgi:threonyl-tRNA synthetase